MPPKGKVVKAKAEEEENTDRPEQPDRAAHEAEEAKIQEKIDALEKKRQDLTLKINDKSKGKDDFFKQKEEIRAKLDEFSKLINEKMEEKKGIAKDVSDQKAQDRNTKDQLSKMKRSIGFANEGEIDQRISEIELILRTDTLTLKQEKEYVREIQDLKKSRPKISQVNSMTENLKDTARTGTLKMQMDTINEALNIYYEGKRKVSEELKALNDKFSEQMGDVKPFMEERTKISEEIKAKIEERKALRDAFRAKEREFNEYLAEQRRLRREQNEKEKAERLAANEMVRRKRDAEKLDTQPFLEEITLIEQTIAFCKGLVQGKEAVAKEEKKATVFADIEGAQVLARKEDREEEYYFAPTAGKKKKGKSKAGKEGSTASKPIKHDSHTFMLFNTLKLEVPITTDDIPATLEKLEAQMDIYKEKVNTWKEQHEEMKRKLIEDGVYPEDWNKPAAGAKTEKAEKAEKTEAPAAEAEKTEE